MVIINTAFYLTKQWICSIINGKFIKERGYCLKKLTKKDSCANIMHVFNLRGKNLWKELDHILLGI